jgi:hypothetical protein
MSARIIKSARLFSKNVIRKKAVEDVVNDCLYSINSLIETANKSNKASVAYRLPMSFAVPECISEEEFRVEVYYTIITILESKEYKVKMRSSSAPCAPGSLARGENYLCISWDYMKPAVSQWMSKLRECSDRQAHY